MTDADPTGWFERLYEAAARGERIVPWDRGGPNPVRGMGVMRDTCEALGIPYRIFGFDSAMSEVVDYARRVDAWMRSGGRAQVASRLSLAA